MTLKNIRLARAENLSEEIRKEKGLPNNGLIIIESRNPELHEEFKIIREGGIRDYLLGLGDFKEAEISEE